jgi:hypothetical protein
VKSRWLAAKDRFHSRRQKTGSRVLELIREDSSGQFALTEKGKDVLANPGA